MTNFQISKKHFLKLALISLVAVAVGAVVGLALNYKTLKELREEQKASEVSSVSPSPTEEPEEKVATFSGKIKPSVKPEIAAHYLEDDEGNIIVFLKSGKIESGFLGILEGQAVEVVGTVEEGSEGQKVLEVDEVHL